MDQYTTFASIYDNCMDNIPYDEWVGYLCNLLRDNGINDGLVAELGCGTGEICMRLQECGYDVIGIDQSEEMLDIAHAKEADRIDRILQKSMAEAGLSESDLEDENSPLFESVLNQSILYLQQDIRNLELYGTVGAFVSICDTMNYLLTEQDFIKALKKVNNYLDRNGVFIFDLKTEHFFADILKNVTRTEETESSLLIWDNEYDTERKINQYHLTIFEEEPDGRYVRSDELHEQRAYSRQQVEEMIRLAGMEFVAAYDAFTKEPATDRSERIYYVARERFQENKHYE